MTNGQTPQGLYRPRIATGSHAVSAYPEDANWRYAIDTQDPTDVVMKLFGPNTETALIAEDDDSGLDANARIAADLIVGQYFVQVWHYSSKSGTGKY